MQTIIEKVANGFIVHSGDPKTPVLQIASDLPAALDLCYNIFGIESPTAIAAGIAAVATATPKI